jgi:hypothetical protein
MDLAVLAGRRAVTLAALVLIALVLMVIVLLGTPVARADGLQAGLWRILTHPVIDGVAGREQQNTRCLTPADVADLEKAFSPVGQTVNSSCEMVERELTPQRLKWHLQCTGQLDMDDGRVPVRCAGALHRHDHDRLVDDGPPAAGGAHDRRG